MSNGLVPDHDPSQSPSHYATATADAHIVVAADASTVTETIADTETVAQARRSSKSYRRRSVASELAEAAQAMSINFNTHLNASNAYYSLPQSQPPIQQRRSAPYQSQIQIHAPTQQQSQSRQDQSEPPLTPPQASSSSVGYTHVPSITTSSLTLTHARAHAQIHSQSQAHEHPRGLGLGLGTGTGTSTSTSTGTALGLTAGTHHGVGPVKAIGIPAQALSPPTPAPSPTPTERWIHPYTDSRERERGRVGGDSAVGEDETEDEVEVADEERRHSRGNRLRSEFVTSPNSPHRAVDQFKALSQKERFAFLALLVDELQLPEALVVSGKISPRLKRDILRDLPTEISLHCISFIDDPRTFTRASTVSKTWNALFQDENLWKIMYDRHLFRAASLDGSRVQIASRPPSADNATLTGIPARGRRPPPITENSVPYMEGPRVPGSHPYKQHYLSPSAAGITGFSAPPRPTASFRDKFRDAYLTESNWLRGGRLLTMHSSSAAVSDCAVTTLVIDDDYIVIGMSNSKIHVFEAETGHYRQTLLGHEAGVWALVIVSPKKSPITSSSHTATTPPATAHNGRPGQPTYERKPSSDVCGSAEGWRNRTLLVSGGSDRLLKVWDLASGQCIYSLSGHTSTIRCLKVLNGRPIAVTGSRDATLRVWDIESGQHLRHLRGHLASVRCIEVAGNQVASGSYDTTCRLWDVDTGECLRVFQGHFLHVYTIAFDGERIISGSSDTTIRVWDAATGINLAVLQGHTSLVGQMQLSGDRLITGGSDGRIMIFDLKTGKSVHRICAHDNSVTCLQHDDRFIVSGGNDGRVKLWDIHTGKFIRELTKPCVSVWRVSFRDDKCAVLYKRDEKTVLEVLGFKPQHALMRPGYSRTPDW